MTEDELPTLEAALEWMMECERWEWKAEARRIFLLRLDEYITQRALASAEPQ